MSQKEVYASLEFQDDEIRFVLGEFHNNQLNILNVLFKKSNAIKNGVILNSALLIEDLKVLINQVDKKMEAHLNKVILLIPSFIMNRYSKRIKIKLDNHHISKEEMIKAINEIGYDQYNRDEILVNTNIIQYVIDGVSTNKINFNKSMNSLAVDVDFYVGHQELIFDYLNVVEQSGLQILEMCFENFAMASEMALIDASVLHNIIIIKYELNNLVLSFLNNKRIVSNHKLNNGYGELVERILDDHNIDYDKAKQLVLNNDYLNISDKQIMPVYLYVENNKTISIDDHYLADIAKEVFIKQFSEITGIIDPILMDKDTEIYLVGKGAKIVGLDKFISEVLKNDARKYVPATLGARDSSIVSGLGAIYAYKDAYEFREKSDISLYYNEDKYVNIKKVENNELEDSMTNKFKDLFKFK